LLKAIAGRACLAAVGLSLTLAVISAPATAAPNPAKRTFTVSPATAAVGTSVTVSATGLTDHALYQVEVCGNDVALGSTDCAQNGAVTAVVLPTGGFTTSLAVVAPPKSCPCVIAGFPTAPMGQGQPLTTPITIEGMASGPVVQTLPPSGPKVRVVDAHLEDSTPVMEWFGFPATRTLALTLKNVGNAPATPITVFASLGATPLFHQPVPGLAPGRERTYMVSVTFPGLLVGGNTMNGHVLTGIGLNTPFHVSTSFWPFGLLLVFLVLVQMVLLLVRNVMRRRHEREAKNASLDPATSEVPVVDPTPTEEVARV
jgi:hypothetical protein